MGFWSILEMIFVIGETSLTYPAFHDKAKNKLILRRSMSLAIAYFGKYNETRSIRPVPSQVRKFL